jgi:predicted RNA-binding protein with PIN domain
MTPYLIIDGYNLMHAAGIARQTYGPGDMERCRSRLNRELVALLSPEVLNQAVIVYDAFESVSDDNRQHLVSGLMVLYAHKGADADTEIEQLLLQHSVPKRVVVVSSDHRLHKAASRRRAQCVDSEVFWASLSTPGDSNAAPQQQPAPAPEPTLPTATTEKVVDDLQRWANSAAAAAAKETDLNSARPKDSLDDLQRWADHTVAAAEEDAVVDSKEQETPTVKSVPPSSPREDLVDELQRWANTTAAAAEKEAENEIMSDSVFDEDYLRQLDKDIADGRID